MWNPYKKKNPIKDQLRSAKIPLLHGSRNDSKATQKRVIPETSHSSLTVYLVTASGLCTAVHLAQVPFHHFSAYLFFQAQLKYFFLQEVLPNFLPAPQVIILFPVMCP